MTRISTAPTRRADMRHRSTMASALARGAIEAAALAAFVLAVVLWADALVGP